MNNATQSVVDNMGSAGLALLHEYKSANLLDPDGMKHNCLLLATVLAVYGCGVRLDGESPLLPTVVEELKADIMRCASDAGECLRNKAKVKGLEVLEALQDVRNQPEYKDLYNQVEAMYKTAGRQGSTMFHNEASRLLLSLYYPLGEEGWQFDVLVLETPSEEFRNCGHSVGIKATLLPSNLTANELQAAQESGRPYTIPGDRLLPLLTDGGHTCALELNGDNLQLVYDKESGLGPELGSFVVLQDLNGCVQPRTGK
ncbi:hypothetical protein GPECTOR_877g124 [Gonium pectorale]|uniref:Uncharacterized protein n=1 Tax=Gonium pectorale TaxID=33097 RepID=A0A150FVK0_GONPE|nr:hypothetical protein GPECTOR_877g124 [Gonium pectorale]|eukprot:KXZ41060.1 hypothetical protein GPECTOR_877g124 [Gonium pectorale]